MAHSGLSVSFARGHSFQLALIPGFFVHVSGFTYAVFSSALSSRSASLKWHAIGFAYQRLDGKSLLICCGADSCTIMLQVRLMKASAVWKAGLRDVNSRSGRK